MKTSKKPSRAGRTIRRGRADAAVDYKDHLLAQLAKAEYAAGYLSAALDEGDDVFLLALRDVAQARGGIKALSQASGLNRENLYDMLSTRGNPRFSSIKAILDKLGLQLSFRAKLPSPKAA